MKKVEWMKEVKGRLFLFMGSGAPAIWHTGTNPGGLLRWQAAGAGAQSKKKKKKSIKFLLAVTGHPAVSVFFNGPGVSFKICVRGCCD